MSNPNSLTSLQNTLLEKYHARHAGGRRQIKLPTMGGISFSEQEDGILIKVGVAGTIANMQSDGAAFEAWALALHVWLDEKPNIIIEWGLPPDHERDGHYERFLYRVKRFNDLFGGKWLTVPNIEEATHSKAFADAPRYVNVARERPDAEVRQDRGEAFAEAAFQRLLKRGGWPFNLEIVDRQLPVGLFSACPPTNANAIFTGRKSAIDLIGANADTATVIELKAGDNVSIGKLSELLFYVQFIRDTMGSKPLFTFAPSSKTDSPIIRSLKNCKALKAVLLVEKVHPLLEHPRLKAILDEALSTGEIPVAFEAWTYSGLENVSSEAWNVEGLTLNQVEDWK